MLLVVVVAVVVVAHADDAVAAHQQLGGGVVAEEAVRVVRDDQKGGAQRRVALTQRLCGQMQKSIDVSARQCMMLRCMRMRVCIGACVRVRTRAACSTSSVLRPSSELVGSSISASTGFVESTAHTQHSIHWKWHA